MIRLKLMRVFQSGAFGPIRVYKRARPADAPHPIRIPKTYTRRRRTRRPTRRDRSADQADDAYAAPDDSASADGCRWRTTGRSGA